MAILPKPECYVVWYRPKGSSRWVKLAEASTWDSAWRAMLEIERKGKGDSVVLPHPEDPNDRPS